jgi:hypothetical protein
VYQETMVADVFASSYSSGPPSPDGSVASGIDRAPNDIDYLHQGALWRTNNSVYQQSGNVAGDPQWLLVNPEGSPLPGDAATTAPSLLLGLKRLTADYTGDLFVAQDRDGWQVSIGQLNDGRPDLAKMFSLLSDDGPIRIAAVFDQSGNGHNATAANAENQPLLLIDKDGEAFLVFDACNVSEVPPWVTARTSYLQIPQTLSLIKNRIAAFNVQELGAMDIDWHSNFEPNLLLLGGANGTAGLQLINYYNCGALIMGDPPDGPGAWPSAAPHVCWLITSPGGRDIGVEGSPMRMTPGDLGASTLQGGVIGMSSGAVAGTFSSTHNETTWRATMVFDSSLSAADDLAVRAALSVHYRTWPQARCNIMLVGESVCGGWAAPGWSWAKMLQAGLPAGVRIFNRGSLGQGVSSNAEIGSWSMVSQYETAVAPLYQSDADNIAVLFPGANDGWVQMPNTPSDEIDGILAWVAKAKATGYRVLVCTLIDRQGTPAQRAYLAEMSPLIRSHAAIGGYEVIDVQAVDLVGAPGAAENQTHFPDGVHPSSPAALVAIAGAVRAAITPYIPTSLAHD